MRALRFLLVVALHALAVCGAPAEETQPSWTHSVALRYFRQQEREPGIGFSIRPVTMPLPTYPMNLLSAKVSGFAVVTFTISDDNSLSDSVVTDRSHEEFAAAAEVIVAQWKFTHAFSHIPWGTKWPPQKCECRIEWTAGS